MIANYDFRDYIILVYIIIVGITIYIRLNYDNTNKNAIYNYHLFSTILGIIVFASFILMAYNLLSYLIYYDEELNNSIASIKYGN